MSVAPAPAPPSGQVRVLLADDSAVVRGLMTRWLAEAGIEIAGAATNGREAVEYAQRLKPNVVVLDVEMPELDGISAIPKIMTAAPGVRILMVSALTRRNAEVTVRALAAGAADYIPKPEAGRVAAAADFRRDLIERIKALGVPRQRSAPLPAAPRPPAAPAPTRLAARWPAELLVIGSSTGGPQALQTVVSHLAGRVRTPIVIVQHMPQMFTAILAEHLAKAFRAPAQEAKDGMPLLGGQIYVAPGDYHLRIARGSSGPVAQLDQSPPVNFCRPAVDPMFASAADAYGHGVVGAVLTGMGSDGRNGAGAIVAKGGTVIAQDEATSVVWGMPGAVAQAGYAAAIKPLEEIGPTLAAMAQGSLR